MLKATEKQLELIRNNEETIRMIDALEIKETMLVQCGGGVLQFAGKLAECEVLVQKLGARILREWSTSDLINYLDSCQEEEQEVPAEAPQLYRIEGYNGEWVFGCDIPNQEHMCMVFRPDGGAHMIIPKVRLIHVSQGFKVRDQDELTVLSFNGNDVVVINHMLLPEDLTAGRIVEAIKQL